MIRLQHRRLEVRRRDTDGKFVVIGTYNGELQNDNSPRGGDSRVDVLGLFSQYWGSISATADIKPRDRVREKGTDRECFVQNVIDAKVGRFPHYELVMKRNPLIQEGRYEKAYVIKLDKTKSKYDHELGEYYGDRKYSREEINIVVEDKITDSNSDLSGGVERRGGLKIIAEERDVNSDSELEIRGKKYRVRNIENTKFYIDRIDLLETER